MFRNNFRLGSRMMLEVMGAESERNEYVEILKRHMAENPSTYGSGARSILEL